MEKQHYHKLNSYNSSLNSSYIIKQHKFNHIKRQEELFAIGGTEIKSLLQKQEKKNILLKNKYGNSNLTELNAVKSYRKLNHNKSSSNFHQENTYLNLNNTLHNNNSKIDNFRNDNKHLNYKNHLNSNTANDLQELDNSELEYSNKHIEQEYLPIKHKESSNNWGFNKTINFNSEYQKLPFKDSHSKRFYTPSSTMRINATDKMKSETFVTDLIKSTRNRNANTNTKFFNEELQATEERIKKLNLMKEEERELLIRKLFKLYENEDENIYNQISFIAFKVNNVEPDKELYNINKKRYLQLKKKAKIEFLAKLASSVNSNAVNKQYYSKIISKNKKIGKDSIKDQKVLSVVEQLKKRIANLKDFNSEIESLKNKSNIEKKTEKEINDEFVNDLIKHINIYDLDKLYGENKRKKEEEILKNSLQNSIMISNTKSMMKDEINNNIILHNNNSNLFNTQISNNNINSSYTKSNYDNKDLLDNKEEGTQAQLPKSRNGNKRNNFLKQNFKIDKNRSSFKLNNLESCSNNLQKVILQNELSSVKGKITNIPFLDESKDNYLIKMAHQFKINKQISSPIRIQIERDNKIKLERDKYRSLILSRNNSKPNIRNKLIQNANETSSVLKENKLMSLSSYKNRNNNASLLNKFNNKTNDLSINLNTSKRPTLDATSKHILPSNLAKLKYLKICGEADGEKYTIKYEIDKFMEKNKISKTMAMKVLGEEFFKIYDNNELY